MKNNFLYKLIIIVIFINFIQIAKSSEQFEFNVTEIEILENGNLYKGLKRGKIVSDDGTVLTADNFIYKKLTNVLTAEGNVEIKDDINNIRIFADKITYKKNEEIIITEGNSKAIDSNQVIIAEKFTYNKILKILNAKNDVKIENKQDDYLIETEELTYLKKEGKIFTTGNTKAIIESKYQIESKNVLYILDNKELTSKFKSVLKDNNSQIYYVDEFMFLMKKNILKGKKILTITNYNLPKSDKFYFSDAIINLDDGKFVGKDTKITVHKDIFSNSNNDPRIYGVSSKGDRDSSVLDKAIFTSCKKNDNCPPWSIKAEKIEHNKKNKQIKYKNAVLNIYDIPVLYFPKFFHPDPTVERQSGLLKPTINNSNLLGSSLTLPYFKVISDNKDYTFSPTWFDNDILSLQNEYRQVNKNSSLIADVGYVKSYKSSITQEKNNLTHLFGNFDLDLKFEKFNSSKLFFSIEQVSNDTYLKVFDANITKSTLRPKNLNILNNQIKLNLDHENYNLVTGFHAYENLQLSKSDRYQYILPYYNFDKILNKKYFNGSVEFTSKGSNNLNNTNDLKSNIINNVNFSSENFITDLGFNNNLNVNLKNLNSLGKKNSDYKSSPQIELIGLFEANTSLPLIKENKEYINYFTPKLSFRFNPSDMKNYADSSKNIYTGNIFSLNRLGLDDTFETGRSLTLGIDFKKQKNSLEDINNFFEFKLATVLRDKEENFVPKQSTINRKNSNIFGSLTSNLNDNFKLNYNFALDNDFTSVELNDFNATFSLNNLITNFKFVEENGEVGNSNIFENSISYNIDDKNFLKFKTRRNRKINLTEYYDLVYEYKNDCLTAGIKYKKSYYEDRDLKPSENLLFTITLFPITSYEYEANDLLNN